MNKENTDKIQIAFDKKVINNCKNKDDKLRLLLLAYFKFNITPQNEVISNLNRIVTCIGYSSGGGNHRIHNAIKIELNKMKKDKLIVIDSSDKIRVNDLIIITIINPEKLFHSDNNFVLLSLTEYKTIIKCKTSTTRVNLFHTYLLIKQYIYDNPEYNIPKVAYPSKKDITKKLGVSSTTTVETAVKDLVDAGLLYSSKGMFIKKDNSFVPTRNVYALDKSQLKMSKDVLKEFYHVDKIYTYAETNGQVNYLTS